MFQFSSFHPLLPSDKTRTAQFLDFTSCNFLYSRYFDDIEHSHVFGPCFVAHSGSINSSHCQTHLEQKDNCLTECGHFAFVIRLYCLCLASNRSYKCYMNISPKESYHAVICLHPMYFSPTANERIVIFCG